MAAAAGGMMIATYSALTGLLVGKERDRALGTVAACGGMASACGTLVGGVLTAWLGWRPKPPRCGPPRHPRQMLHAHQAQRAQPHHGLVHRFRYRARL